MLNISNTFSNILSCGVYNCIYYFSKGQIIINKLTRKINKSPLLSSLLSQIWSFISKKNIDNSSFIDYEYEYVKIDGNNVNITEEMNLETNNDYDFLICKRRQQNEENNNHNNNNGCINYKLIYHDKNDIDNNSYMDIDKFELSNIKFILIECYIGEKIYKIDLKTDKFNFYLVNNKLNKSFFVYYIKQHLDIINNIDINENCRVKLIDQNINISNIDFTINEQYIVIKKDTYIIYKS